jgi:hypothetical protein
MSFRESRPVAGISIVSQNTGAAFLGLYICHPDYRGQGLGWELWQWAMARHADQVIGLDGVPEQQANYARSGFAPMHRTIRYQGLVDVRKPGLMPDYSVASGTIEALTVVIPETLQSIVELDAAIGGTRRTAFIDAWIQPAKSRVTVAAYTDGVLAGFTTIRQCRQGHKIGPLLASDTPTAHQLLVTAVMKVGASEIILDVPEPNGQAMQMAESLGLSPVFETARMYRGRQPGMDLSRIYGVGTLELG